MAIFMEDIIIIGIGGMGREILFQLEEYNRHEKKYNVLGFVDDNEKIGTIINSKPVLGDTSWLSEYKSNVGVIIGIGHSDVRKMIYQKISQNNNLYFPVVTAWGIICPENIKIGQGSVVCFNVIITVNNKIGEFALISNNSTVAHDANLGDFVTLYPCVNISGNVNIGDCCEIGVGSKIIQGLNIGKNTIIGAGSVVVKDIPEDCVAVGVPAKPARFRKKSI